MIRDGSEFFIVDNSDEHWKALEYVRQWCEISRSIDIATGHFEIGALLALDGEWQKVDKIRILIGGETSGTTASAIAAALRRVVRRWSGRSGDPFLTGAGGCRRGDQRRAGSRSASTGGRSSTRRPTSPTAG